MDVKITLPLLPLRDIVVFPSMVIPLFVGRDKSISALNEVMKSGRIFRIKVGSKEVESVVTNSKELARRMTEAKCDTIESIERLLEEEVREHDSMLAKLEQNKAGQSDWDYREKHRRIKSRIEMMTNEFRAFKKVIFNYVKNL